MATLKSLVDETTNIKDELVECHANLKNTLIKKGVECSDTDKMSNLIDKVENIETGIKFSTGTITGNFGSSTTAGNSYTIDINLDFTPSKIFVLIPSLTFDTNHSNIIVKNDANVTIRKATSIYCSFIISDITKKSFTFRVVPNTSSFPAQLTKITWYAFE